MGTVKYWKLASVTSVAIRCSSLKKELPSESGSWVQERDASSQIICKRRKTSLLPLSPKVTPKPSLTKGFWLISVSAKTTMF